MDSSSNGNNPHVDAVMRSGEGEVQPSPTATYDRQGNEGINLAEAMQNTKPAEDHMFRSASGVTFLLKKYSNRLLIDATKKFVAPKVPMSYDEVKKREVENPKHPDYLAAVRAFNAAQSGMVQKVQLGFGTEVVGTLPEGMPDANDESWSEDLKDLLDIDIPEVGTKARYIAWMQYVVLTDEELNTMQLRLQAIALNLPVEEVEAAVATFSRVQERGADSEPADQSVEDNGGHQDTLAVAGDGAGV